MEKTLPFISIGKAIRRVRWCTPRPSTMQKWLNQSRCHLGADWRGPIEQFIKLCTFGRHLANTIEQSVLGSDAVCR